MSETSRSPLSLFEAFGVELEYMIVDAATLDVRPIADDLLAKVGAVEEGEAEVEAGVSWSNELTRHLVEFKTSEPARTFEGLAPAFQANVARATDLLRPLGCRLMPTAMHPWMNPNAEMKLWPHGYQEVYRAFDRIFDCTGHGWANLQSAHINLPFADDAEFARLHAAIRVILPILPALSASSPFKDGSATGLLDTRLDTYKSNARKVPSVSGRVIPEPVFSRESYEREILGTIYKDLAPHDPDGLLRYEWANARGAIARFDRGAIEIRVLDVQECPAADVAICAGVARVLEWLSDEGPSTWDEQRSWGVEPLRAILDRVIVDADRAVIDNAGYLGMLGVGAGGPRSAGDVWRALFTRTGVLADGKASEAVFTPLETILSQGPLARRIVAAVGPGEVDRRRLSVVYRRLCECLDRGEVFRADR